MANVIGLELLFQLHHNQIVTKEDAFVIAIHALCLNNFAKCVGLGAEWSRPTSTTELLPHGWNSDRDVYVLRYVIFNPPKMISVSILNTREDMIITVEDFATRKSECQQFDVHKYIRGTNLHIFERTFKNLEDLCSKFEDLLNRFRAVSSRAPISLGNTSLPSVSNSDRSSYMQPVAIIHDFHPSYQRILVRRRIDNIPQAVSSSSNSSYSNMQQVATDGQDNFNHFQVGGGISGPYGTHSSMPQSARNSARIQREDSPMPINIELTLPQPVSASNVSTAGQNCSNQSRLQARVWRGAGPSMPLNIEVTLPQPVSNSANSSARSRQPSAAVGQNNQVGGQKRSNSDINYEMPSKREATVPLPVRNSANASASSIKPVAAVGQNDPCPQVGGQKRKGSDINSEMPSKKKATTMPLPVSSSASSSARNVQPMIAAKQDDINKSYSQVGPQPRPHVGSQPSSQFHPHYCPQPVIAARQDVTKQSHPQMGIQQRSDANTHSGMLSKEPVHMNQPSASNNPASARMNDPNVNLVHSTTPDDGFVPVDVNYELQDFLLQFDAARRARNPDHSSSQSRAPSSERGDPSGHGQGKRGPV